MKKRKIHFKRLDHFQICIPPGSENIARDFYVKKLGLAEIEKPVILQPNGGLWLEVADVQLHIGTEMVSEKTKGHPAFEIEHLEAAKKMLIAEGVKIKEAQPIERMNRFYFYDPFGNRIELLEMKK